VVHSRLSDPRCYQQWRPQHRWECAPPMPFKPSPIDPIPAVPAQGQVIHRPCEHPPGRCRASTHSFQWGVCPNCGIGRWIWRSKQRTIDPCCPSCARQGSSLPTQEFPTHPQPGDLVRRPHISGAERTRPAIWLACRICTGGKWIWVKSWKKTAAYRAGGRWTCRECELRADRRNKRMLMSSGYVQVYVERDDPMVVMAKDGHRRGTPLVSEHRLVVARWLGRPLEPWETVHHRNGDRQDNRLENLELWKGAHNAGVRHRDYHCPGCVCGKEEN
jgi:hypothetical protein